MKGQKMMTKGKTQVVLGLLAVAVVCGFAGSSANAAVVNVVASNVMSQTVHVLGWTFGTNQYQWDIFGDNSIDDGLVPTDPCFNFYDMAGAAGWNAAARITHGGGGEPQYDMYPTYVQGNSGTVGVDFNPTNWMAQLWGGDPTLNGLVQGDDNYLPFKILNGTHGFTNNVYGALHLDVNFPNSFGGTGGSNGTIEILGWSYDPAGLPMAVTPEPATMSLLALGGLAMIRRRRRA